MTAVVWGLGAALVWGLGDFLARFTSRGVGPTRSLFGALIAGAVALTLALPFFGGNLVPPPRAFAFSLVGGVLNMAGLLVLYAALARGPVTAVAPICASHPALAVGLLYFLGVKPAALQWAGMGITMGGVLLLTRDVGREGRYPVFGALHVRGTVLLSMAASVLFAFQIVAMQEARESYGAFATSWLTRWISLAALLPWALVRKEPLRMPVNAVPLIAAQGLLDASGNLFLLFGSLGPDRAVVTVVASVFAAVTVVLARWIIKEPMTGLQWLSIAIILGGVGLLAGTG